jgi:hypothetical protein
MGTTLTTPEPEDKARIRVLSLGAGPQTSTLLLLACEGRIPAFDAAIFADPGWLHDAVYQRLQRLGRIADAAGIPLYRVSAGNIRADALDADRRFASMPLWYRGPAGGQAIARRQCVSQYKTRPVKAKVRELLGYPHPARVPRGIHAELAIGLAAGEISRASDPDVRYLRYTYPLVGLGWSTADCVRFLVSRGLIGTVPAACLGCPFHGNRWWRHLRDDEPGKWDDVVAFDRAIRHGHPRASGAGHQLRGSYYLHLSRQPLGQAHLGPARALNGLPGYAEDGIPGGCSPWTRHALPPPFQPTFEDRGPAALIRRFRAAAVRLARATARRLTGRSPRHRGRHAMPSHRRARQ